MANGSRGIIRNHWKVTGRRLSEGRLRQFISICNITQTKIKLWMDTVKIPGSNSSPRSGPCFCTWGTNRFSVQDQQVRNDVASISGSLLLQLCWWPGNPDSLLDCPSAEKQQSPRAEQQLLASTSTRQLQWKSQQKLSSLSSPQASFSGFCSLCK